ncbi:tripartite tricarboxylate transporter TctB family protein [uncultured Sulfitobacter sp.]|uniref:tripartite tricarboxylate transporter TctB family protein n=1 Tax=uncultured Sulfitobacter sp. TaxID=191468 RepID=UPI00261F3AEE|nr:tripartite tricarboxylate transporter TctB family protein [uncultured Sulfitobacter sp.]
MKKVKTLQDLFKRYRRPGDLVFSVMFLLFSIALLFSLPTQNTWVGNTKLFSQPAFWPYAAVITMAVFSALHLVSSLVSPALDGRWREVWFWIRSIEFAGWFMAYVIAVPQLGYLPATVLVAVTLTWRLGYRSAKMLLLAAGFGCAVVLIFKTFLQVKVPGGALYELLPTALRSFMLTYF